MDVVAAESSISIETKRTRVSRNYTFAQTAVGPLPRQRLRVLCMVYGVHLTLSSRGGDMSKCVFPVIQWS